jgi:hypothetical protein
MRFILVILAALAAFSCAACPPTPPPPPKPGPNVIVDGGLEGGLEGGSTPTVDAAVAPVDAAPIVIFTVEDAGTGEPCDRACARLRLLGCPEGTPSDGGQSCVTVCQHAQGTHLTELKPECLAGAKTVLEVQACKTVRCAQADGGNVGKKKP